MLGLVSLDVLVLISENNTLSMQLSEPDGIIIIFLSCLIHDLLQHQLLHARHLELHALLLIHATSTCEGGPSSVTARDILEVIDHLEVIVLYRHV